MNENLVATQEAADLTRDQIVQLAVNAYEASWLEAPEKRDLLTLRLPAGPLCHRGIYDPHRRKGPEEA